MYASRGSAGSTLHAPTSLSRDTRAHRRAVDGRSSCAELAYCASVRRLFDYAERLLDRLEREIAQRGLTSSSTE